MAKKKLKKSNQGLKKVAIIMGSDSDFPKMKSAAEPLDKFGIPYDFKIVSAHRTPDFMYEFAKNARKSGYQVIIAGAGGAAHLPGMVASLTELPVIGVPVEVGPLSGMDSLYSIVQMPKGVPVATVAINNSFNAGLLAAKILASNSQVEDKGLFDKILKYSDDLKKLVLKKVLPK